MTQLNKPVAAVQTLQAKVGIPAFREKLARDWNIVPRNDAELQQLLQLGQLLQAAQVQEQVKSASVGNPFLASAIDGLQSALGQEGIDVGLNDHQTAVKEAAFTMTQDKDVAFAALEYANYLAATEQG